MICIGRFKNLDDAIKARKDAEEKYYKPLIGRYDGPIEKTNCVNQTIAMPLI